MYYFHMVVCMFQKRSQPGAFVIVDDDSDSRYSL